MGNAQASALTVDPTSPHIRKILEAREKLTGWERVQLMFKLSEFGEISPELQRIWTGSCMGLCIGAFLGAMGRGRIAHSNFLRSNAHEIFNSPLEAKRKLQDTVTLGMGSGAFRIGWRMGLFTGMYLTVSTFTATYRGKTGMVDQITGAGVAGFLYKFPQGPKAAISGGFFGSLLGVGAGLITLGLAKLTGNTIDNANLIYYQTLAKREEKKNAEMDKTREFLAQHELFDQDTDKFNRLTQFHDKLIAKIDGEEAEGKSGVIQKPASSITIHNQIDQLKSSSSVKSNSKDSVVSVSSQINENVDKSSK